MKKYEISMDEKDKIDLGGDIFQGNKITIGSSVVCLGSGNSVCYVNGVKIVSKRGKVFVNGKLYTPENDRNRRCARRIVALVDIYDDNGRILVRKGEKGGYVESEDNLSQEGSCWIYDDAMAIENAFVSNDARLAGKATLRGNAKAFDHAIIKGRAEAYGNARFFDHVQVSDEVEIYGNVTASGNVKISGSAELYGNVNVSDNAKIYGKAEVYGNVSISDNAEVFDKAEVFGNVRLSGNVKVCRDAEVFGTLNLDGNQVIKKSTCSIETNNIIVDSIVVGRNSTITIGSSSVIDMFDEDDLENEN